MKLYLSGTILDEAKDLVHGNRGSDYGHPADDFKCTASLWTSYLRRTYPELATLLRPEDVAMMMALLKISREAGEHKRDNLVDLAGYAETCQMVHDGKVAGAVS